MLIFSIYFLLISSFYNALRISKYLGWASKILACFAGIGVIANLFFLFWFFFFTILIVPSESMASIYELSTLLVWHLRLSPIVNLELWVWEGAAVLNDSFSTFSKYGNRPDTVSHYRILTTIFGVLGNSIISWSASASGDTDTSLTSGVFITLSTIS